MINMRPLILISALLILAQAPVPAQASKSGRNPNVIVVDNTDPVTAVDAGNKTCPVSGEKIGSMGAPVDIYYKGKRYHLCCPMCIKDFKKQPGKYSAIAQKESR